MKSPEQANPWRQTADGWLPEPGEEEGQEADCSVGTRFSAEVMEMFWNLVEVSAA